MQEPIPPEISQETGAEGQRDLLSGGSIFLISLPIGRFELRRISPENYSPDVEVLRDPGLFVAL